MDDKERTLAEVVGPCHACGGSRLTAVFDGEETNFLCQGCGSCWRVEFGWVDQVRPGTCPGCPSRARCLAAKVPYSDARR